LAIHADPKLAAAGERKQRKLEFEISTSIKKFDENSQARFHNSWVENGLPKSPMHNLVHNQSYIK